MAHHGIIDSSLTDSQALLPMKYIWARRYYRRGMAQQWHPEHIVMDQERRKWLASDEISDQDRRLIVWNLGFFSIAHSLVATNIVLIVYRAVTSPECRQYLLRQAYECAIHSDVIIHCCDSFHCDPMQLYGMYTTIPSLKEKIAFVRSCAAPLQDVSVAADDTVEHIQSLLLDLVGFYLIMEGVFFHAGFAMMRSLKQRNLLAGVGTQYEYVMRDVDTHIAFGCDLINTIKAEHHTVWTPAFQQKITETIVHAVALEQAYLQDLYMNDVANEPVQQLMAYVHHVADYCLERIDLPQQFGDKNPFGWMASSRDFQMDQEFFDDRNYYRAEQVEWDE